MATRRPIKVVCIGAGYSSIALAIQLKQTIDNLDLTIYEKEDGLGGVWYANRYPGLTCDIPSHCYQFSFEPNPDWSSFYAPGPEICAYLSHVSDKYEVTPHIRLKHTLLSAVWDDENNKWRLRICRDSGNEQEEFDDTADVLFLGVGSLSRWKMPDIPGLASFKGQVIHSAAWPRAPGGWEDTVAGWEDKAIGVVGTGASGIQIVTALQPSVRKLVNFARGGTYVSAPFSENTIKESLGRDDAGDDHVFTEEEKERFRSDPQFYSQFREKLEASLHAFAEVILRDSPVQAAGSKMVRDGMKAKLAGRPDLADKLIPHWPVCCRRLVPGLGYLEALCADNAILETDAISQITPTGVTTSNGTHHPLDILVLATGFDTSFHYPFMVTGLHDDLSERWGTHGHASAYLSLAVDGFPNMFLGLGPGSYITSGHLVSVLEAEARYIADIVGRMQREGIGSVEVRADAVAGWEEHARQFFPRTVHASDCQSWMRAPDGTPASLWPGSGQHAVSAFQGVRWDDYICTPLEAAGDDADETRMQRLRHQMGYMLDVVRWLGDGMTLGKLDLGESSEGG
ncbi:unnamed protein product [Peniophora sp. CBMAI 1063]|nr:unnamed protein product [Peniophora sp. CBMAI 1063]